jgi:DNA invertase Pin-like site-specific DNA recombinase
MLKIGYLRPSDPAIEPGADRDAETARLTALGCDVIRTEEPARAGGEAFGVLRSVLEFIGAGDQLVVQRLEHLGVSGRAMLAVFERLEDRGASLRVLEPELSSQGQTGAALRAALEAVAALEPARTVRQRRVAAAQDIRALQRAGVGPVEIARRLGVSRMTVWRKLKALETCGAAAC